MFRFYSIAAFVLVGLLYLFATLESDAPFGLALIHLCVSSWRDIQARDHWTLIQVVTALGINGILALWTHQRTFISLYASIVLAGFAVLYNSSSGYAMREFVENQTTLLAEFQNYRGADVQGVASYFNAIASALPVKR